MVRLYAAAGFPPTYEETTQRLNASTRSFARNGRQNSHRLIVFACIRVQVGCSSNTYMYILYIEPLHGMQQRRTNMLVMYTYEIYVHECTAAVPRPVFVSAALHEHSKAVIFADVCTSMRTRPYTHILNCCSGAFSVNMVLAGACTMLK